MARHHGSISGMAAACSGITCVNNVARIHARRIRNQAACAWLHRATTSRRAFFSRRKSARRDALALRDWPRQCAPLKTQAHAFAQILRPHRHRAPPRCGESRSVALTQRRRCTHAAACTLLRLSAQAAHRVAQAAPRSTGTAHQARRENHDSSALRHGMAASPSA